MAIKTVSELIQSPLQGVPSYIGDGVLPIGGKIIIAGEGGVGKSILVSQLALDLAAGNRVWGVLNSPKPLRVLYIENEIGEAGVRDRFRIMSKYKDKNLENIVVASQESMILATDEKEGLVNAQWDAWKPILEAFRPDVVIADPLATFHTLNENDNSDMKRVTGNLDNFARLAREKLDLNISWIIVHHFKKVGQDDKFNMSLFRGASRLTDWADTRILIRYHAPRSGPDGVSHHFRQISFAVVRQGPPVLDLWLWVDPCSLGVIPSHWMPSSGLSFG